MSTTATKNAATFARGIHPGEHKQWASDAAIEVLPTPAALHIALLQHTGAPCVATVKPRDPVALGDVIGEAQGFISAPVHASASGKAAKEAMATLPNGRHVPVIPIKPDPEQPLSGRELYEDHFGGVWPTTGLDQYEPKAIADAARAAGLVGLGGAAFPTHVKLLRNEKKPIDTLVINGCECEPFLTADDRLMTEAPAPIVTGALLALHATGARRAVLGIEDNKPRAIASLRAAAAGTPLQIQPLETKYPQGSEKQLIDALTGRKVPLGGLPLDVGVVVINVTTAAALARAVLRGKPLTHRIVTVTGGGIAQPRNVLAPIGASFTDLIAFCGGLLPEAARVIAGGPMMGFAVGDLAAPVTKGTSGITVMTRADLAAADETSCVRCGRCVDACPMNLLPTRLALAARAGRADLLDRYHIMACMECGSCAWSCPARLPLVQLVRVGKLQLRAAQSK